MPYSAISPRRANEVVNFAPCGGEPDIAHQRLGEPDAGTRPVDGGDDRLAQGGHEMRMAFADELADVGLAVRCWPFRSMQVTHVGPGAERPPAAGEHDRPAPPGRPRHGRAGVEPGGQAAAPRVHPLGPVEGQHGYAAVAELVEHRVAAAFGTLTGRTSSDAASSWMYAHTVHLSVVPSAIRCRAQPADQSKPPISVVDLRFTPRQGTWLAAGASGGSRRSADRAPTPRT